MFAKAWNKMPTRSRFRILDKANAWGYKEGNSQTKFNDLTPHVQGLLLKFSKENHDKNLKLKLPKRYVRSKNGIMKPEY